MSLRNARLLVCVYHRLLRLIKHQTASLDKRASHYSALVVAV